MSKILATLGIALATHMLSPAPAAADFRYTLIDLGGSTSEGTGVNDSGQVVGGTRQFTRGIA
jgi:hypothetical protein